MNRQDIEQLVKKEFENRFLGKTYNGKIVHGVDVCFYETSDDDGYNTYEELIVKFRLPAGKSFRWMKYYF